MDLKKLELQRCIDAENGINYHRNVNLSGYTVYRGNSFITFRFIEVNNINTVVIDYLYVVNKTDLVKLLSWCLNFWSGNATKFIYYKEHERSSNVVEKFLPSIGFKIQHSKYNNWKHKWKSTNGYAEEDILEAFTD